MISIENERRQSVFVDVYYSTEVVHPLLRSVVGSVGVASLLFLNSPSAHFLIIYHTHLLIIIYLF